MVLTTDIVSPTALLFPPVRLGERCLNQKTSIQFHQVAGLKPVGLRLQTNAKKSSVSPVLRMKRASMICSASLNAAMQTQTVVDNRTVLDGVPTKETKKPNTSGGDGGTPKLDDGSGGAPPHKGGGGGGGGGGSEGPFYGGFYLFLFLAFVTWLNEEAEKSKYVQDYRKRFTQFE